MHLIHPLSAHKQISHGTRQTKHLPMQGLPIQGLLPVKLASPLQDSTWFKLRAQVLGEVDVRMQLR